MKFNRILTAAALSLLTVLGAKAVPACPTPVTVTQPDGRALTVRLIGDEFHSWSQTLDGRTLVRDAQGRYCYAVIAADGTATPSAQLAHNPEARDAAELAYLRANPSTARPAMTAEQKLRRTEARQMSSTRGVYNYKKFRGLVILVNFTDVKFRYSNARQIFADIIGSRDFTGYTPPGSSTKEVYTGSVRDYFRDQSCGKFDPQFDVVGPFNINYRSTDCHGSSSYMGMYMRSIMSAVINAANPSVNFRDYDGDGDGVVDMFYVIFAGHASCYSGNNGNLLWPHASTYSTSVDGVSTGRYACSTEYYGWQSGTSYIDGIGTICHEFSHVLGLRDEYDTDYESGGGWSADPGGWSIMASGTDFNKARNPVGYSMLQRMQAGFAYPKVINGNGVYQLDDIDEAGAGYRINTPVSREFFLLENRRKNGSKWNAYAPGEGLLVFRVDSTSTTPWSRNTINANPAHNYYQLIRARGSYTSEGPANDGQWDPFPGSANVTSLTPSGTPAFLTWGGKQPYYSLDDIWEGMDKIYVRVGPDASRTDVEDFEAMTTPSADEKGVQGRFTRWDFTGATVVADGDGHMLSMAPESRALTADLGWRPVRSVGFRAINRGTSTASVRLQVRVNGRMVSMNPVNGGTRINIPAGQNVVCAFRVPMIGHTPLQLAVTGGTLLIDDFSVQTEEPAGVQGIDAGFPTASATLTARSTADGIEVICAPGAEVSLYDLQGRRVAFDRADESGRALLPAAPGCYIAAAAGASAKILHR